MPDTRPSTPQTIRSRRTHKQWDGSPVSREQLTTLVELGTMAPMHRLSNPWHFCVFDQPAVQRLRTHLLANPEWFAWPDAGKAEKKRAKICDHYLPQLGGIIHVTCATNADPLIAAEDRDATAAAVQNILLAAEDMGLAVFGVHRQLCVIPSCNRGLASALTINLSPQFG